MKQVKNIVLSEDYDLKITAYKLPNGCLTIEGKWKTDKIKNSSITLTNAEVEKLKLIL